MNKTEFVSYVKPSNNHDFLHLSHDRSEPNISTSVGWISMEIRTDTHGSRRMKHDKFNDPLNFALVPPCG